MDEWHIGDPVDWGDGWMDAQNWGHGGKEEEDEPEHVNPAYAKRDNYSKMAWDCYMEFKEEDALHYIDLALDLDKRHAGNWNKKGIILQAMKRYAESEKCYNRSLELAKKNIVYDNKARMLYSWSHHLTDEARELPDGSDKLREAEKIIARAINTISQDSEEDIDKYLRMRDSIKFLMDYENRFRRNLETLKGYDKSELFTIT